MKNKQQFSDDQEQINPIKKENKGFWNYLRSKKGIKDVEIEEEIDFEYLESEILEMERNVVTNKELNFDFAQPTIWDNFHTNMIQNLKKSGITKRTYD